MGGFMVAALLAVLVGCAPRDQRGEPVPISVRTPVRAEGGTPTVEARAGESRSPRTLIDADGWTCATKDYEWTFRARLQIQYAALNAPFECHWRPPVLAEAVRP